MSKLRVHNLSMSLDGFAAGPDQTLNDPLGKGGERLHEWAFATRTARNTHHMDGGEPGVDDDFMAQGDENVGATIMGRNMFGPVRGPWPDESWTGWWGDEPPYHHPVFVLTHHERPPLEKEGGTTFTFVTDGIESALEQATGAANGKDIRIGGGPSAIQQYMKAGLIDELHVVVVPVLLGRGERLFGDLDDVPKGYECADIVSTEKVAHVRLVRT